jgi:RNA polymerase sigma-70 factor (ECF subfamily)|tara:strand:+ start:3206 stop:3733 length:528 start_codon:yes stop_codon:yes gene_type:complete
LNSNAQPIDFYEELLGRLQPRLYGYILSMTASPTDAKDVLQESNRVIIDKIGEFQQPNKFDAWAYKIAYYQSLAFLQKRKRNKIIFNDDLLQNIADETESADTRIEGRLNQLETCLAQLHDRTRVIVSDYYYRNLSIKQIAEERTLKTNHIAQVLFRARKALFQCMTKQETDTHE